MREAIATKRIGAEKLREKIPQKRIGTGK